MTLPPTGPKSSAELEWGTPVLYMRSPDGRLFDVEPLSEAERRQNEMSSVRHAADSAETIDNWDEAVERWEALLSLAPTDPDAHQRLDRARDQQTMRAVFVEGQQHDQAGRWRQAFDCYYRVVELGGDYNGVFRLLARVRRKLTETPDSTHPTPLINGTVDTDALSTHRPDLLEELSRGNVVVFLGTDANLCGRPDGERWLRGQYLPSGGELAEELAALFRYPGKDHQDLVRVAEYVEVTRDWGTLYDAVRNLLNAETPPTPLHQFLARSASVLRAKGYAPAPRFIVTANFDDGLERAFQHANEPFDLVMYSGQRGLFFHKPYGDDSLRLIDIPNQYVDLPADPANVSTVIVKIHGAFDRKNRSKDSYVITEDNYIDYSSRIPNLVPAALAEALIEAHSLFIGYSMRDWHLRVFLHPIWRRWSEFRYTPWVVPWKMEAFDAKFWGGRKAEVFGVAMDEYVAAMSDGLQALAPAALDRVSV